MMPHMKPAYCGNARQPVYTLGRLRVQVRAVRLAVDDLGCRPRLWSIAVKSLRLTRVSARVTLTSRLLLLRLRLRLRLQLGLRLWALRRSCLLGLRWLRLLGLLLLLQLLMLADLPVVELPLLLLFLFLQLLPGVRILGASLPLGTLRLELGLLGRVLLLESCAFGGLLGRQSPFVGIRTGHSLSRSRWSWRCGRLHGSGHRRHTRFLLALGRLARAHRR